MTRDVEHSQYNAEKGQLSSFKHYHSLLIIRMYAHRKLLKMHLLIIFLSSSEKIHLL